MNKKMKIWLICATSFITLGCIIFLGVMCVLGWDFKKLSTDKLITNEYEVTEEFKNILVKTVTAKVEIIPSNQNEVKIVCNEYQKIKHSVTTQNDTLVIDSVDTRKWYQHLGIHLEIPKITLYIPKSEYGSIKIKNTTGDINLRDINCKSLDVGLTTGNVIINNTIAEETLSVNQCTGNFVFDSLDAGEIFVKITTGNVMGSVLTDKIFEAKTTTGNVSLPSSPSGGLCKIKVTTGNIKIDIASTKNP